MIAVALLFQAAAPGAAPLAPPVVLTSGQVETPVSASLRFHTAQATLLPSRPVAFRLQCFGNPRTRGLEDCHPLAEGEQPATDLADLRARTTADDTVEQRALAAALKRVALVRLAEDVAIDVPGAGEPIPSFLITEVVAPDDAVAPEPSSGAAIPTAEVIYEQSPRLALLRSFYPQAALRTGTRARMVADCVVQPDRTLFCRDPRLDPPDQFMVPAEREAFGLATLQLLSTFRLAPETRGGEPVVGRTVRPGIVWALP